MATGTIRITIIATVLLGAIAVASNRAEMILVETVTRPQARPDDLIVTLPLAPVTSPRPQARPTQDPDMIQKLLQTVVAEIG
jgi:hypothetical protein